MVINGRYSFSTNDQISAKKEIDGLIFNSTSIHIFLKIQ